MEMDSHGGLEVTIRQTESKKKTTQQLRETDPWVLVMSINRTRWLDKLRPAGASSGGWTEGPMAPVETTDAATVDQRCPFKHRTGWRHNHSNSKLCVALRMSQANLLSISNCHPCAGAMLSSHSILQATRFVRVILEQESISSSQGEEEKKKTTTRICACYPCASHTSVSFKKKKNHLRSWLSFLCRGHEAISRVAAFRRRNSVILAQGPCNSVQWKIRRQARHEVRTSGPALEGSIVSRPAACPSFGLGFGLRNPYEAVIKMIIKGRSPTVRHESRTHRVGLDWLFERINLDRKVSNQVHRHQTSTCRHIDKRKFHTWWVEQSSLSV